MTHLAHNSLNGLTLGDAHSQYLFLNGRSGGQVAYGGTDPSDGIQIHSTTDVTKGLINATHDIVLGIGEGGTTQATGLTMRAPEINTGGVGDIPGADLFIQPGLGTGVGDPGAVVFNTSLVGPAGDNPQVTSNNTLVLKEGRVGVGLVSTSTMPGLAIEAGVLTIKETTTPTADSGYGKIYTKSDNLLYFQDGSGVEKQLALQAPQTLQLVYDNSPGGAKRIVLDTGATDGFFVRDNATPIGGDLFGIQNNAGTTDYLAIDTTGIKSDVGINIDGHSAFGNVANILTDHTMTVYENSTSTSNFVGQEIQLILNPGSVTSALYYGQIIRSNSQTGNIQNFTGRIYASQHVARHRGTGTLTALYGINAFAKKDDIGGVSTIYGLQIEVGNANATGTVGTAYGLRIEPIDQTGTVTNPFAIYQVGANDDSYFAGPVTVDNKLTVTGLIDPLGVVITEQSSTPWTAVAGYGAFWVKNTVPSTPWYTDDSGADFQIATTAILNLQLSYDGSPVTARNIVLAAAANEGIFIKDNATPIGTALFTVQNNAGSTDYLSVSVANVAIETKFDISQSSTTTLGDTLTENTYTVTPVGASGGTYRGFHSTLELAGAQALSATGSGVESTTIYSGSNTLDELCSIESVAQVTGTGTVADVRGICLGVEVTNASANVTESFGLYIKPTVATGTISTRYGIYQDDANDFNLLKGSLQTNGTFRAVQNASIGQTAIISPDTLLNVQQTTSNATNTYGVRLELKADTTSASQFYGGYFHMETTTGANFTGDVYGLYGYGEAGGTGTVANLHGQRIIAQKSNTGPVTTLYGSRIEVENANATGTVTTAYGVYLEAFVETGTISNKYGFYQAGSEENVFNGFVTINNAADISGHVAIGDAVSVLADQTLQVRGNDTSIADYTNANFYYSMNPTADSAGNSENVIHQMFPTSANNFTGLLINTHHILYYLGSGSITSMRNLSIGTRKSSTGSIGTAYGILCQGGNFDATGTITNFYHIRLNEITTTGTVTNKYALYQDGATDIVHFNGPVTVNNKLTVTGLIDPTGVVYTEQTSVPWSWTAGYGAVWVKDDAPTTLWFTDDMGVDHQLAYGSAYVDLQEAYNNSPAGARGIVVAGAANQGFYIRDNATPMGTALFFVQNNAGSTDYLNVDTSRIYSEIDLDIDGHAAIGADASIDANHVLSVRENTTATSGVFSILETLTVATPSAASSQFIYGTEHFVQISGTNSHGGVIAFETILTHIGSGAVGILGGMKIDAQNNGLGTIVDNYGIQIEVGNNDAGGSVGDCYGLHILPIVKTGPITGNEFAIFQQGVNDTNRLSGLLHVLGHSSFGSTTLPTDLITLNVVETYTDTSGTLENLQSNMTLNPSGATTALSRALSVTITSTTANNYTGSTNAAFLANVNDSTGTLDEMYGAIVQSNHDSIGTVTDQYGLFIDANVTNASGTTTNIYTLYIAAVDQTGTITGTPYALYQAGANDENYFAGLTYIENDLRVQGHAGIGNNGTLSTDRIFFVSEQTGDTGNFYGTQCSVTAVPSATHNNNVNSIRSELILGSANNFTDETSTVHIKAEHFGTGTVSDLVGADIFIRKQSTGPVTNAYGTRIALGNYNATNLITNGYGLYIEPFDETGAITNHYAIYQAGSSDESYFAGHVTVDNKLTVSGLIDPTGVVITEQSSVPWTPVAGYGAFWVRDDAPTVPMFTDDAGTDHLLPFSTTTTLQVAYNNSASTAKNILLAAGANEGVFIRDNATPIGTTLFAIQNSAGTADYLSVTPAGIYTDDGLEVDGNTSLGNNASIDSSKTLNIDENKSPSLSEYSIYSKLRLQASSVLTQPLWGIYSTIDVDNSGAGTIGIINAGEFIGTTTGASPHTDLRGITAKAIKNGNGNIGDAYGVYAAVENASGVGTIGDAYGVYIASTVVGGGVTNQWGIYQAGSTETNFFAGATNQMNGTLDVGGHVAVGGSASVDAGVVFLLNEGHNGTGNFNQIQTITIMSPSATQTGTNIAHRKDLLIGGAQNFTGSIFGTQFEFQHNGTGTVSNIYGAQYDIEKNTTGPITNVYGLQVLIENNNATGAITNAYAIHIPAYIETGTITNKWGIYQLGTTTDNYLQGTLEVDAHSSFGADGSVSASNVFTVKEDYTGSTNYNLIQADTLLSPTAAFTGDYIGIRNNSIASQNFNYTGTIYGFQSLHEQAGINTASNIIGAYLYIEKSGLGTITTLKGVEVVIENNNATGAITNAYAFYAPAPVETGTITNKYGFYILGSTVDNYLAGTLEVDGAVTFNDKLTVSGLIDPTGLVLTEQSSVPWTPAAGYGAVWVKDDTPSTLWFTDDAGTDFEVALGPHTLQSAYDGSATTARNIVLANAANEGVFILDNATPIGTTLFGVQNNAGSSDYLIVDDTTISSDNDLDIEGRSAFGGAAGAPTTDHMMKVYESTDTLSNHFIHEIQGIFNPSGASAALYYGQVVRASSFVGNAQTMSRIYGIQTVARHNGTNTLALLLALNAFSKNESTGTVSSVYGGLFEAGNANAGGTVTTAYGIRIEAIDQTGPVSFPYGIYQAGPNDLNLLAGHTRVGSAGSVPANTTFFVTETYNSTATQIIAAGNHTLGAAPSGDSSTVWRGTVSYISMVGGFNFNNTVVSTFSVIDCNSTGNAVNVIGVTSQCNVINTATVTNVYGVQIDCNATNAGCTVTNLHALHIDANNTTGTVTNNYAIYQAGANDLNYFAGSMQIGTAFEAPFVLFPEESSSPWTSVAGYGAIWVRDDAPTTLMFSDDVGEDHIIHWKGNNILYVGKHGNDSNHGDSYGDAFLTFGAAITAAIALTPSSTNRIAIHCEDAGNYVENFTVPSWCGILAPAALIDGNQVVSDNSLLESFRLVASSGVAVTKTAGTAAATVVCPRMILSGLADGVRCNTGTINYNGRSMTLENGDGFDGASTINASIESITITGTGVAISATTGRINYQGTSITDSGSGVGLRASTTGIISGIVNSIDCNTAVDVNSATAEIDLYCTDIVGTISNSGTLNYDSATRGNLVDGARHFNVSGADVDFRIESDSFDDSFFLQGSNGYIGLGTDAPNSHLHLFQPTTVSRIEIEGGGVSFTQSDILFRASGSTLRGGGSFYHNSAGSDNWFWGRLYGSNQRWGVAYKTGATFDDSTSDEDEGLLFLTEAGSFGVGYVTPRTVLNVVTQSANSGMAVDLFSTGTTATPTVRLGHSLNATKGSHTATTSGTYLGEIRFEGSTGTTFVQTSMIRGRNEGTTSGTNYGGYMEIWTTPLNATADIVSALFHSTQAVTLGNGFHSEPNLTFDATYQVAAGYSGGTSIIALRVDTSVVADDLLGRFAGGGQVTGGGYHDTGYLQFLGDETWGASSAKTKAELCLADTGGTTPTCVYEWTADGATIQNPSTTTDGYVHLGVSELQTTGNTVTTIITLPLLDDHVYHLEVYVVGVQDDGTNRASYQKVATAYRTGGGSATQQGATSTEHSIETDVQWNADFAVSGNNLLVQVNGDTGQTVNWVASLQYTNVSE